MSTKESLNYGLTKTLAMAKWTSFLLKSVINCDKPWKKKLTDMIRCTHIFAVFVLNNFVLHVYILLGAC